MKLEAQRIAIAEACGWEPPPESMGNLTLGGGQFMSSEEWRRSHLPDYINDLNAMHEAEKSLNDENDHHYSDVLESVVGARLSSNNACDMQRFRSATAAQRAEAFLRTLNLWTDE